MLWRRPRDTPAASGVASLPLTVLFDFLKYERARARSRLHGAMAGESRTRWVGDGIEFERFRPFSPGDDVRRIDWRASAMAGELQLRLFESHERLDTTIILDRSASMGRPAAQAKTGRPDAYWLGCTIALAVAWLKVRHHEAVTIVLPATQTAAKKELGPLRSETALGELQRVLLAQKPAGSHNASAFAELAGGARASQRGKLVVLISDFLSLADDAFAGSLRRLAAAGGSTIAIAIDGHRCEVDDLQDSGGSFLLRDSELTDDECIVELDERLRSELDTAAAALLQRLRQLVDSPLNRVFQLDIAQLRTQADLLRFLGRTLHAAGLL